MKKSKSLILFIFLLGALVVFAGTTLIYIKAQSRPKDLPQDEVVLNLKITQGMNASQISKILYSNGIIRNERVFYLFARFPFLARAILGNDTDTSIKQGMCRIKSSMNVSEIYAELSKGQPELFSISIPEGLTLTKIARRFENAGLCMQQDFIDACHDKELLLKYSIPAESAEGFLFPDTYAFEKGRPAKDYVSFLIEKCFSHLDEIPEFKRADASERLRLVTLASIIEREYRVPEEAPLISSVFTNRLKNNIGLYSCATVEYVITEILKRPHPDLITYDDLKIESPYNTYRNAGLPPGPISNPGLVSLKAAAEPASTDYFYFRITDSEKGVHAFSRTFQEHINEGVVFKTKKAAGK